MGRQGCRTVRIRAITGSSLAALHTRAPRRELSAARACLYPNIYPNGDSSGQQPPGADGRDSGPGLRTREAPGAEGTPGSNSGSESWGSNPCSPATRFASFSEENEKGGPIGAALSSSHVANFAAKVLCRRRIPR